MPISEGSNELVSPRITRDDCYVAVVALMRSDIEGARDVATKLAASLGAPDHGFKPAVIPPHILAQGISWEV